METALSEAVKVKLQVMLKTQSACLIFGSARSFEIESPKLVGYASANYGQLIGKLRLEVAVLSF